MDSRQFDFPPLPAPAAAKPRVSILEESAAPAGDSGQSHARPSSQVSLGSRVVQVLHTHQGRDKLFKVVQYLLRLLLVVQSKRSAMSWYFTTPVGHDATVLERNLTTLTNGRRLMRIGRFVAEFVRLRATFIKCSEIEYAPARISRTLQTQMLLDIGARLLMCAKSVLEDVVFFVQKGVLNRNLEAGMLRWTAQLSLPVLLVDLYLNSLRLAQGIVDASVDSPSLSRKGSALHSVAQGAGSKGGDASPRSADSRPIGKSPFSLLSTYQRVDRLRKRQSATPKPSAPTSRRQSNYDAMEERDTSAVVSRCHSTSDLTAAAESPSPLPTHGEAARGATPVGPFEPVNWQRYCDRAVNITSPNDQHPATTAPLLPTRRNSGLTVNSYAALFWADFELHWIAVNQFKLSLDLILCLVRLYDWRRFEAAFATCGLVSGLLSVYRVWTYGS